MGTAWRSMW
jgi:hypothetical protein